jgi:trimethylamine:corrinoid methyltransferase-like protein
LWVERNTYYKQAGYCFRTQQAIQYFGNAGCSIHNEARIRFPPHIRRRIDDIMRLERVLGCPR